MAKRRGKNVRKLRAKQKLSEANSSQSIPPQLIIYAQTSVGRVVQHLQNDLRLVFEPYVAKNFIYNKKNRLRDVVGLAQEYKVSHIMYFTHNKASSGLKRHLNDCDDTTSLDSFKSLNSVNSTTSSISTILNSIHVNMHLIRLPNGPRLTFRVQNYCLRSDIQKIANSMLRFNVYNINPPLLMVHGFTNSKSMSEAEWQSLTEEDRENIKNHDRMLKLVSEAFRGLVPNLNVHDARADKLKRVLLISRDEDITNPNEDIIYVRHFRIVTQPTDLSRPIRKLLLAQTKGGGSGAGGCKHVPDLSHCKTMKDFVANQFGPDSEVSDFEVNSENEIEADPESNLPLTEALFIQKANSKKESDKPVQTKSKHAIRLKEIGPRMSLKLLKIEGDVNAGPILFHRYQQRKPTELRPENKNDASKLKKKKSTNELSEGKPLAKRVKV